MAEKKDVISLLLPLKPEYVSLVRLTTSGIATRVGFNIDEIEDIKVSISEICTKLIDQYYCKDIEIKFEIINKGLCVSFKNEKIDANEFLTSDSAEFAQAIISSLMDEVIINKSKESIISVYKYLER